MVTCILHLSYQLRPLFTQTMQASMQHYPRPPRSASLRSHRTLSNTSSVMDDDEMSVSSSISRRGNTLPKISTSDFSAVRAVTGISRMKKGRRGRRCLDFMKHCYYYFSYCFSLQMVTETNFAASFMC